jgi:hypothetical protein
MFKTVGSCQLVIDEIRFAECRYTDGRGPEAFDICFHVHNEANPDESDWIRLEHSECYGKGNFATVMQKEVALKTLRAMGFDSEDLSILVDELTGRTVPGYAKESKPNKEGKVYINVYFGSGAGNEPSAETTLSKDEVLKRLGRVFGSKAEQPKPVQATQTPTPTAAPATTTNKSPFKR